MRFIVIFISIVTFIATPSVAAELVGFDSQEGIKRLERSDAKVDFFPLANHFESQENKIFCGLASSAIVLNALRLDNRSITKPQDGHVLPGNDRRYLPKGFDPIFERYTQHNVFQPDAKSKIEVLGKPITIKGKPASDYGLQLHQLAALLTANGIDVTTRVVDDAMPEDTIRNELVANMHQAGDYVLVNYSRKTLGQGDVGHISPLGAYDKKSDSFLVLDVNPNTSKWVWITTHDLVAAMRTLDTVENRGYVLVKEGKQ